MASSTFKMVAAVTCYVLLCVYVSRTEAKTLNIVWFCPKEAIFRPTFSADNTVGSIEFALQNILNDPALLPEITDFDVRYKDSACDAQKSYGGLMDLFAESFYPDLVVGPLCTGAMVPIAQQASALNIPVFGWVSSDPVLEDKSIYTTIVRLLMPVKKLSDGIVLMMDEFSWDKADLISTVGGDFGVMAQSIRDSVTNNQKTIINWIRDIEVAPDPVFMRAKWAEAAAESRIIIFVVPTDEIRDWVLAAQDEGLDNGEYVLIYVNQELPDQEAMETKLTSPTIWQQPEGEEPDGRDEDVKKMMQSMLMLYTSIGDYTVVSDYLADFMAAGQAGALATKLGLTVKESDFYSLYMNDALMMFAYFGTRSTNYKDGKQIRELAQEAVVQGGATGTIIFDDSADRVPDFWMFSFMPNNSFAIVAETVTTRTGSTTNRKWSYSAEPRWGDGSEGKDSAPKAEPACGFYNEKCPNLVLYIVPAVVCVIIIVAAVGGFFLYRKLKYESNLKSMAWKMEYNDLIFYTGAKGPGSMMNMRSMSVQLRSKSKGSMTDSLAGKQLFTTIATYKGAKVTVKSINKQRIKFDRTLLQEMRMMQEIKHPSLNAMVGAVTDAPHISYSFEYATRGSLQDVIWAENFHMDEMFKFPICNDMLKGLSFLHDSPLKYHGRLKSSNVVIDGRWSCKLTDYGLQQFCEGETEEEEMSDYAKYSALYWTPPELLREHYSDLDGKLPLKLRTGTQEGDMYAVGVIMKEVFCRNGPYTEHEELEPHAILQRILTPPKSGEVPLRPSLSELADAMTAKDLVQEISAFITACYAEDPKARPNAKDAYKTMSKINPYKKMSVMDIMMAMMEKYSSQLEETVAIRAAELEEEKKKTEDLLEKMLPKHVAEALKFGKMVEAEQFECVTMYFSDIPGFSQFAATSSPHQVVDLLNAIYSLMDGEIQLHDVYKVETVGDVYVSVSGLPQRNGDRHIVEIMNCALDLLSAMMNFVTPHKPNHKCYLRMGVHTGPIVTGVIGLAMPRYCLFGDTINTTSRMESTGKHTRIHMSPAAKEALSKFSGYKLAERGEIAVKGKGNMTTYWLLGHQDFNKTLPDWNKAFKDDSPAPKMLPVTTGKSIEPSHGKRSMESGYNTPPPAAPAFNDTQQEQQEQSPTQLASPREEESPSTQQEQQQEEGQQVSEDPAQSPQTDLPPERPHTAWGGSSKRSRQPKEGQDQENEGQGQEDVGQDLENLDGEGESEAAAPPPQTITVSDVGDEQKPQVMLEQKAVEIDDLPKVDSNA